MNLNLNSLLVSSEDYKKLTEFYSKVLEMEPSMAEEGYSGFLVGNTFLSFGAHDKIKGKNTNPDRILINFETADVKNEFERIKGLGAKVITEPYSMGEGFWIATLADPDDNYFQLMSPWKPGKN
jgi:predicted enzyme related to lactoylglutathione lyase